MLTLMLTGHRPEKLGLSYDLRTWMPIVERVCNDYIIPLTLQHGTLEVISGMALGWDMIGARAALMAQARGFDVGLTAAVPFIGQESRWSGECLNWYRDLIVLADEVVVVSTGGYAASKMQTRNVWMVKRTLAAHGRALAAWDGSTGGTGNCMRVINKVQLPFTNVWMQYFEQSVQQDDPPGAPAQRIDARGKRAA